jgi:hypothetical protein
MKRICLIAFAFSVMAGSRPGYAAPNLVTNPGFEESGGSVGAQGWDRVVKGAPPEFKIDRQITHDGQRSMRIQAPEITRAYVQSSPIPAAPGEKLRVRAWARTQDVPAGKGTTIVIAEFVNTQGARVGEVKKVGTAVPAADWQEIAGTVEVPAQAAALRLWLGFSYSMGTVWWDDVQVESAGATVAARVDLPEDRLYPAAGGVPVTILNRSGRREPITVRVVLGQQRAETKVKLTGEPTQAVKMPVQVKGRGKLKLQVEILDGADGGKALFSLDSLTVTVPPALTLAPLIPTHGVIEDGPALMEGEFEIAFDAGSPQRNRVAIALLDPAGKVKASRELDDVAPAGTRRFEIQAPSLPEGSYRLRLELPRSNGAALTAEQPWKVIPRREARTIINPDGFPEHGGRAIFPLGMFNNSGRVEECAAAGFNIVHTYNAARVHPGHRPDDQRLKDLLDRTEKAGMHCLLLVPMEYSFVGDWDSFRRRIRMFRNHPALLAWDEEEGLARGDINREMLIKMREILTKEDPHHPFMVGDSHDVIGRVKDRSRFFPDEQMDMGMWWWYPLPLKAGAGDDLQGESAQGRLELDPPPFLTQRTTRKPVWVGLQSYKKPGPDGRYPTPAEYRAQAYVAIAAEAKGLMWYGGSVTGGLFLKPEEGHWDDLKSIVAELRGLSPLLLRESLGTPTLEPPDAPISCVIKPSPRGRLLIAVNRGQEPCEVGIRVSGLESVHVLAPGGNRSIDSLNGLIRDRFDPLAVHLYDLPPP